MSREVISELRGIASVFRAYNRQSGDWQSGALARVVQILADHLADAEPKVLWDHGDRRQPDPLTVEQFGLSPKERL